MCSASSDYQPAVDASDMSVILALAAAFLPHAPQLRSAQCPRLGQLQLVDVAVAAPPAPDPDDDLHPYPSAPLEIETPELVYFFSQKRAVE